MISNQKNGLRQESRVLDNFTGDNVDGTTNIIPCMGLDRLLEGYQSIMRSIYAPRNYYKRVKTLLRDLKAPEVKQPLNVQRFLSFFRSALRLGVLGKERLHYWQLMAWTLVRKPSMVSVAVTLSIYGYHYRRVCELHIFQEVV